MATPPIPVQDAPRVEVDLVHDAAAVRLRLDAEDALRTLVLHETQGLVGRLRLEELVAILGNVSDIPVLHQDSESLVDEDIDLGGLENMLGLQQVTEGVLNPEPVQGLSQAIETQCTLGVSCGSPPGGGRAVHGHPVCQAADSGDVGSLR